MNTVYKVNRESVLLSGLDPLKRGQHLRFGKGELEVFSLEV